MLKNDNIVSNYFPKKNDIVFSFGKPNIIDENSNNKMNKNISNIENRNNNKRINDGETYDIKIQKCISIYKLLNKNKPQAKENSLALVSIKNMINLERNLLMS